MHIYPKKKTYQRLRDGHLLPHVLVVHPLFEARPLHERPGAKSWNNLVEMCWQRGNLKGWLRNKPPPPPKKKKKIYSNIQPSFYNKLHKTTLVPSPKKKIYQKKWLTYKLHWWQRWTPPPRCMSNLQLLGFLLRSLSILFEKLALRLDLDDKPLELAVEFMTWRLVMRCDDMGGLPKIWENHPNHPF